MSEQKANIGVVGMAVMGSNLARNLAHHGYTVAIYNRTFAKTQQVLADHGDEGNFIGSETVEGFVQSIEHPRSIILMVKAGAATDATIAELLPHLEQGDIIMDGGNFLGGLLDGFLLLLLLPLSLPDLISFETRLQPNVKVA